MNIILTSSTLGIATGILGLVSSFYFGIVKFSKMELKIDTLWDFQLRRGMLEALEKGVIKKNSPITLTPESRRAFIPFEKELRTFYANGSRKLSDRELAIKIEERFGDTMVNKICRELHLSEGACLILAIHFLRPPKLDC